MDEARGNKTKAAELVGLAELPDAHELAREIRGRRIDGTVIDERPAWSVTEIASMKSQNFEFLRPKRAVLADLAGFAERYAHEIRRARSSSSAASSSTSSPRSTRRYRLRPPLLGQPERPDDRGSVPAVRSRGRPEQAPRGAEGRQPRRPPSASDHEPALARVPRTSSSTSLAGFTSKSMVATALDAPTYVAPPPEPDAAAKTKEALEKLRLAEAKYESVLAALEEETQEAPRRRACSDRARDRARAAQGRRPEGRVVPSIQRGDDAPSPDRSGAARGGLERRRRTARTPSEVRQEVRLCTMPTPSGEGFADYVLYGDDGKPLAVIEAKKTVEGRARRRRAGAHLRRRVSRRRPACARSSSSPTASTSSSGTTRRATRTARSTASTRRTASSTSLTSAANKKALATVEPNLAIANRMYQLEAVKRVCERFSTQLPQGAPRAGDRHRQDPRRRLALRRPDAGRLGEAHPVPLRPAGAPQAGGPRLQGVHAWRAARRRRQQRRRTTATSASTSPPTRR